MADIDSILINEASRLDKEIHRRSLNITNFWVKAIQKGEWEDGMGINPRVITYEPTTISSPTAWATVALNDGTGQESPLAADTLAYAKTIRTYHPARYALQSPYLALDDIRMSFEFKDQLAACFDMCTQNTMWAWEARNRAEYVRLAAHKVIIKDGFTESAGSFPTAEATGRVTGQILKKFYRRLIDLCAAKDGGAVDMVNGAPQFIAVMSPELDDVLVNDDYQIREDFRQSNRSNELLRAMGVDRPYKGFYHVIDHKAPRYNFTGGAWVEVPAYTTEATTEGNRLVPNPSYETATHEDTIIFLPTVYQALVPRPLPRPGGNTDFDPMSYQGEWKWINFGHNTENPDRDFGRFRGVFWSASKPKYPDFGFVLRGLRPNLVTNFIDSNGNVVA